MHFPLRLLPLLLLSSLAACGGSGSSSSRLAGPAGMRVAETALANGAPSVALQVTATMLQRNPRDTEALLRQAEAYQALGRMTEAEQDYRRALGIDDRLSAARLGLGKILLQSNPTAAEAMFQAVLAQEPRNTKAMNDIGVARDMQGHHADAQTAYNQALALAPELASARQNLGLSLAISGKPAEGVQLLGQLAREGDSDRRTRDDLAVALTLNGRADEANKVLREELNEADASKAIEGYRELSMSTASVEPAPSTTAPAIAVPAPVTAVTATPLAATPAAKPLAP